MKVRETDGLCGYLKRLRREPAGRNIEAAECLGSDSEHAVGVWERV